MAALTADVVVVELEARMNQYTAAVSAAANRFAADMSKITAAAGKAEGAVEDVGRGAAKGLKPLPRQADDAEKAINRTKFATANLAAQFQDIGVMIAAGQSPFLLMLQQGTQVAAVMASESDRGVKGALGTVGGALRSLISPVSLLSIGFVGLIAAAGSWVVGALSGAEDVEAANDRVSNTLDRLKQAYGEAKVAVEELTEAERIRLALLTENDLQAAQREYADALRNVFTGPAGNERLNAVFPDPGASEFGQQMRDAIGEAVNAMRSGNPDLTRFREELERIMFATDDPGLDNTAQMLLDLITPTSELEQRTQDLADQLIVLTQRGTEEAEAARARLGIMTEQEAALQRHIDLLEEAGGAYGRLSERTTVANDLLLFQLERSNEALRGQFVEAAQEAADAVQALLLGAMTSGPEAMAAATQIGQAFSDLVSTINDGEPDVEGFRNALARLANLSPENQALRDLADAILAATASAAAMQGPLAAGEAAIKGLATAAAETVKPVMDANWAIAQLKDMMGSTPDKALVMGIYEIGLAAASTKDQIIELDAWLARVLGQGRGSESEPPKPNSEGIYVKPTRPSRGGGGGGGGGMSEAERLAKQIEDTIAALRFQAEQITRTAREQAVYNALQRAGIDANHEMADEVRAAAEALFDLEEQTRAAREEWEELVDVTLHWRDEAWDAFESIITGSKSAKEAIRDLIKELLIAEARALILRALTPGTANDPAPGPISAIFSVITGLIGRNAGGTDNWRGGWSWVGERGPELLNLPRGSQVVANHNLNRVAGGFTFAPVTHIQASGGATREEIAALLNQRDRRLRDDLPAVLRRHQNNRR